MTPTPAAAAPVVEIIERDRYIARVHAALQVWRPYLEGRTAAPPAVDRVAVERGGRLELFSSLFGLDPFEIDIVLTLWVLAVVPEYRAAVAALDAGGTDVSALSIARLYGHPHRANLAADSPLLAWLLVGETRETAGVNPSLVLDPHAMAWLEGWHELDRALLPYVGHVPADEALPTWPIPSTVATVRDALDRGDRVRVQVITRDRHAAWSFACAAAAAVRLPVLAVLPGTADPADREFFVRVQRQAFFDRSSVLWPRPFTADEIARLPLYLTWFPLQFVVADAPGAGALPATRDVVATLTPPGADERRELWRRALPESRAWDAGSLDALAERYVALPTEIREVAAARPASADEAARVLLARSRGDLGGLAQRLETPFLWDDLVVPTSLREVLQDITFEARDRVGFWEQSRVARLFPQGRGLVALFCGPPGTGKTMAAQVMAAELGLDLYRVDLSAVISKWVGETSQNLQKILARAADRNIALFFDEADAIYGKRVDDVRDAQDRFSNMDVSHLMVAIESYSGVVWLASNLKANIDPAFIRRIRYCVEFPQPDHAARHDIWTRVISAMWGPRRVPPLAAAIDALSAHEASGAQIKNACLSAAFVARRAGSAVTRPMLARAFSRELAKDGSGLSERALAALAGGDHKR